MNIQCKGCEFAKKVETDGGWSFMGCTFEPYQGKKNSIEALRTQGADVAGSGEITMKKGDRVR